MPIFKPQTFKEAFAEYRKLGRKTFTWKGKKYHTRTKEEVASGKPNPNKGRGAGDPMHGPHPDKKYHHKEGDSRAARRGGSIRYQDGKETPDPTGTTQGEPGTGSRPDSSQMIRYQGGQGGRPPGREAGRGSIPPNMQQKAMNQLAQYQQQLHAQKQEQFQQLLQELQVKNQQLEQQNQLLNTKIQKDEMINKARTIPSNLQKAITSPKKKGGSNSPNKKPKVYILGSNGSVASTGGGGGQFKKGGSCGLPGGRSDMRKRRR